MKKKRLKKMLCLGTALAMSLSLFTACGSSSSNDATSSSSTGGTTTNSDGLTEVTFVSPTALESFDYLAIYVAQQMGYFKDEGLDVKLVEQVGSDDVKMLASGQAQFAYPSPGIMWSCIDSGIDDVEAILNYDSIQIFGFAINKDSGIKDFSDLKGKQIGTPSEGAAAVAGPILEKAGLSTDDVEFVNYGDGRYEAVASGQTPALFTWLSEWAQLEGQGYDLDYLDGNTVAPQVSNSLCTSKTYLKEHPDVVKSFCTAYEKALYFCYLNPEGAADMTLLTCPNLEISWDGAVGAAKGDCDQFFGISDDDKKATIEKLGQFDMTMCQNAVDNIKEAGTISGTYKAEDYYTNDIVNQISIDKAAVEKDASEYQCTSEQYKEANQ